jgi:hypothetical protein
MDIGKEIREVEFEDPAAVPAPVEPSTPAEPVTAPAETPAEVPVGV